MRYQWVKEHRTAYSVTLLCGVLQVSNSGYYQWLTGKRSQNAEKHQKIAEAAIASHKQSNGIYGYRKVQQDLIEEDIICCQETVRRVMKEVGIHSRIKRKFVVTTDSEHSYSVAENILSRDFTASKPDRKWLTDITYIGTNEGWLYLAAVLDVFSRKVVGWAMSDRIDTALVRSALNMAVSHRMPEPGLLHHSDRGVQYASDTYQQVMKDLDIICSMSRKGNCWDNAMMESFFGSVKTECVYLNKYMSREQAKQDLFKYIEIFYNRERRHASLGYVSPEEFERRHKLNKELVA